jgi:serine/threonine protein kinase
MSVLPEIPGYKIIRKLGHGGMADVYLGMQENLEREVAIKVLAPFLFRDDRFAMRFIKEAQTAARLAHPNIITIHDVGQVGDTYYIVMEYLEESLTARLKKLGGALDPKVALKIVRMTAGALDYAHRKGFIHRDIKPDNIMFRSDGTVVLVDFGIARAIDSTTQLTRTGMSIGTPHYMSPEQCRGEKIDGRSDIYSLGVQLFELLTGTVPYTAENTAGIILKHIQDPIPRLPNHLAEYQLLIEKMMAKDREKRIQTGAELVKFIDAVLTAQDQHLMPTLPSTVPIKSPEIKTIEEPTVQTPVPTAISFRKQPARKKWLLPVLLGVAVILTVVSIYLITQRPTEITETGTTETGTIETGITETVEPPTESESKTGETEQKSVDTQGEKEPLTEQEKEIKKEQDIPKTTVKEQKTEPGKKQPLKTTEPAKKEPQTKPREEPKIEKQVPEEIPKTEVKQTPVKSEINIKTVSLLELDSVLGTKYNDRMARITIPVPRLASNFKVTGQVVLTLFINEKGNVTVLSYNDNVTVIPQRLERRVKAMIRNKIDNIYLPPPQDKDGAPVKIGNWRVAYKVVKLFKQIILIKQ